MIKYDYEITVNGNQAKLNKDIYLFRGNKNVHYYFAVKNASFNFKGSTDLIEKTNAINAAVTVIKPNNVEVASAIAKVENGKIHLKVTEDLIDEEVEVGDFDLVFDLFDDTDGAVTIPKVIGQFHVLERPCTTPISELVATNTTNEVDQALTDYAIVTYAEPVASTNADGTFAKKTWVAKEKITTAELNRMEEGISDVSSQCKDIANYSLAVGDDGLLYLSDGKGNLLGNGIDVKKMQEVVSNLVSVFTADFSGATPLASQFYAWENRVYGSAIYDALSNIQCIDNVAHLTSVYDSENSRWKKQMMCTGGLFESDNFICEFEAKLDGKAGSWNNVITYGTGTHWTNGMYSDGVKWPAGGEIDAFEQAGGYSENPNYFKTPTVHYGSGTGSGYSNTHESKRGDSVTFTINEWHKLKFELVNGCVKIWIDDVFIGENDFSDCVVNNNYLYDYKPFLKPQAFYIDGSCADNSDTSNTYDFSIKNFKIFQEKNVECTGLEIYPQMWGKGTELIFPTDAELFFDKIFTPSNVSNKACKWESTNPSVATVCEGYVKTLTEGTTTIKTTCGTITATYELTVNNTTKNIPCVGLELEGESKQLDIDTTASFKTYVYPKFTTDDLQISYSNNGIVTYDGNTLTAIKAGTTTITVDCGAKTVSFEVTVNDLYGSNAILSYTFDNSTIANNLTVENKGSLGSEYNLIVNCLKDYSGGNVLTTPSALTIPTREAGETYLILIDLYDALDRTVQSAIQGTGRVYFTEVENSANQPNIISTHANISSGGNWQQAYNGSPYEKMLDNPCRVALWRDNTGKSYIYSSKDSEEKIISKSSADTYIKNITKIRLEKARINKLDIYYSNKTVDEVKVLVNDYSS